MKYYNANQASRKLGISRPDIIRMIRQNELKVESKKGVGYCIPESEIKRLEKELKRQEENIDKQFANTAEDKEISYTITRVSEKLGIERHRIKQLVKTGKIYSIKGQGKRSPYLIPENQLQKIHDILTSGSPSQRISLPKVKSESESSCAQFHPYPYEDILQIQRNISETMIHLASAQERMAFTLEHLVKKYTQK